MISYRRSVFIAPAIWLGALIFSTLGVRGEQAPAPPVATRAGQAPASDMFALSSDCIACHNNLVSPAGEDVSIGANCSSGAFRRVTGHLFSALPKERGLEAASTSALARGS